RHFKAMDALYGIAPAAEFDAAIFDGDARSDGFFLEEVFHFPLDRLFHLSSVVCKSLREITLPIKQRDRHHWQTEVGRRTNRIARPNTKPAAVAGHGVF